MQSTPHVWGSQIASYIPLITVSPLYYIRDISAAISRPVVINVVLPLLLTYSEHCVYFWFGSMIAYDSHKYHQEAQSLHYSRNLRRCIKHILCIVSGIINHLSTTSRQAIRSRTDKGHLFINDGLLNVH